MRKTGDEEGRDDGTGPFDFRALLKKSEFAPTDSLRRRRGLEGGNGGRGHLGGRGGSGRPIPVLKTPTYDGSGVGSSGFPSPGGGSTRQMQQMEMQALMMQEQQQHVMYDENVIDL